MLHVEYPFRARARERERERERTRAAFVERAKRTSTSAKVETEESYREPLFSSIIIMSSDLKTSSSSSSSSRKNANRAAKRRSSTKPIVLVIIASLVMCFGARRTRVVVADELLAQEAEMEKRVTCGSAIKLTHASTKVKLHSHGIGYGSGSGQQSVTGFPESNDPGGYWQVFGTKDEPCERGEDITDGRLIRLQHLQTRKWLHSHAAHRSPLTNNQEVSAHGDEENSDAGDEWKFEVADGNKGDKAGPVWKKDQKVRLQHRQTKAFLSCSNTKFQRPISGQSEVCGTSRSDANSVWKADQGVYFPKVDL